jgi:DNA-binding HxlR family transcriptional regulator
MENYYMSKTIGIFKGLAAKYNILILETLYDNGPLTAWELTRIVYEPRKKGSKFQNEIDYHGKKNLHPTLNKSLRRLEKKGYVIKKGKQWIPNFKGIIANLLLKPRPWSEKLTQAASGVYNTLDVSAKFNLEDFRKYENWVRLAELAKELMEQGMINFDVIKNKTLMTLLIAQDREDFMDKLLR